MHVPPLGADAAPAQISSIEHNDQRNSEKSPSIALEGNCLFFAPFAVQLAVCSPWRASIIGWTRSAVSAGAALLLGYGTLLNLAPFEFGQVAGLYLATLLVVWQAVNFVAFRTLPTLPVVLGGSLVIAGGAIITFWKPG
jgi:hypothetical protein